MPAASGTDGEEPRESAVRALLIFVALFLGLAALVGLIGFLGRWELLVIAAVAAVSTWLIARRRAPPTRVP